jgi:hypothetical protein
VTFTGSSGGNRSVQLSCGRARVLTVYVGEGNGFNVKIARVGANAGRKILADGSRTTFKTSGNPCQGSIVVDEEQRLESCSLTARFARIVLGKISLIAVATPASSAAPAATISAIAASAPAPAPHAATAFGLGPRLIDVDGASAH